MHTNCKLLSICINTSTDISLEFYVISLSKPTKLILGLNCQKLQTFDQWFLIALYNFRPCVFRIFKYKIQTRRTFEMGQLKCYVILSGFKNTGPIFQDYFLCVTVFLPRQDGPTNLPSNFGPISVSRFSD